MPSQNNNNSASTQDIALAYDMLKDSKSCIAGIARAATESTNNQIRQFYDTALDLSVDHHFQLADLLISKGWYQPWDVAQLLQSDNSLSQQMNLAQNQTQSRQTS